MIKSKNRPQGMYRLFVKVRDPKVPIIIDKIKNVQTVPVKWKEVSEINIGSVKVPNKDVYQVKWVWEQFEPDGQRMSHEDFFKRFFFPGDELEDN